MTPEQRQEEISKAYLHAIAAKCGFAVANWSQDHGCVDATVGAGVALGGGHIARPKIDVQLKATTRGDVEHADFVSWTLEAAHYDALREQSHVPHILVVLLLPHDIEQSVEHSPEQLVLRRCAYWVNMTGMQPESGKSKTVRIPKSQVFSPESLAALLTSVSQGTLS